MTVSPLFILGAVFVVTLCAIAFVLVVSSRFYIERSKVPFEYILNTHPAQIAFDDARLDGDKLALIRGESVVALITIKPRKREEIRAYFLEMTGIQLREYAR